MHMPLHQQVRGDDFLAHNHRQQQLSEADGFQALALLAVKHKEYHRIHSQDSPSDIHGTQPSDTLHQMACYEPQGAGLQSEVLSAPIPLEKLVHRQYRRSTDHVLDCTSSYNSLAPAE